MINASVAIQVLPTVSDDDKLCFIVDKVIDYIKSFNLKTVVSPFETTIEGDFDTLMEIVKNCQLIAIKAGAPSLMSFVKICYSESSEILTIDKKINKYKE
ncbi:MAG: thiamine-binding protein [Clostridia bacterium]